MNVSNDYEVINRFFSPCWGRLKLLLYRTEFIKKNCNNQKVSFWASVIVLATFIQGPNKTPWIVVVIVG